MLRRLLKLLVREHARGSALLLLVCLFLPVAQIAVAWTQSPEAALPACCRAHGKHQCSMFAHRAEREKRSAPAFGTATLTEKCPCLACGGSAPIQASTLFVEEPHLRITLSAWNAESSDEASESRLLEENANHKRGPPNFTIAS